MSTQRPSDEPGVGRALRRASPLLGNEDLASYGGHDRDGARGPRRAKSLRRTIQGLKDRSMALGRSRSLSAHKTPPNDADEDDLTSLRARGLSRSLTDVSVIPPMLASVASPTPPRLKRLSAQPRLQRGPVLSVVSEGLASDHVSPHAADQKQPSPVLSDVKTLRTLHGGTFLTKVSAKKHKVCLFRLEPDLGQIVWVSKKHKIIPIETIKEIRSGEDTRYTREQLHLAKEYEDRWLTIIYILDGTYKTLNLIAPDRETFQMWDRTLRDLYNIRKELMRGLGNWEMRQAIWEKQYWKAADEEPDHKLSFSEIESLCRKLNINSSRDDLSRLFTQADSRKRNYLDFDDFRRFVKLLKARPEIDRLYKKLRARNNGIFDFKVFEGFMKIEQKSTLTQEELQALFYKFSAPTPPLDHLGNGQTHTDDANDLARFSMMTLEGFTSFLLSPDNSAFVDQYRDVSQPMTRPLSEYFISSSHNTYLLGHQIVGTSSVEGYIRALLHGCRSVEVDIYDGETEPMIFHGKTLTTKVSLREVCKAITKYGFSTSPYPIIISAEVHCSVPQQERIAVIMVEEFGDALVRMPTEGVGRIEVLPSPEDLKGKILLKAKNQDLVKADSMDGDPFMSEMSSSASDSDAFFDIPRDVSADPTIIRQPEPIVKGPIAKAKTSILERVKSVGTRSTSLPKDGALSQSPPPINALDAPAPSPQTKAPSSPLPSQTAGFFQRARRSLRGSSSSASDAPSLVSETSTSSADANASLPSPPPKPLTLLQRLRTNKSAAIPIPAPIAVPAPFVILPRRIQSADAYSAASPETVLARSPPPLSATTSLFPVVPRSAALTSRRPSDVDGGARPGKPKMSPHLLALLVYTVGVKCRGLNKKEEYAPEHMFSLSEKTAQKMLRFGMWDLIKHTKTHMVRTYPKGTRVSSTNYEPHRFWAAGAQLVALNWQTFDLGYMINYAMFQRNGRSGYVLKPDAIRLAQKDALAKRVSYTFDLKVISGQQLPRPKDALGHEIGDKPIIDPYVEVTLYVPDWPVVSESKKDKGKNKVAKDDRGGGLENGHPTTTGTATASTPGYSVSKRTSTVKKNGFNPVWEDELSLPFDCVGDMMDLVFVRFVVRQEVKDSDEPLAVYCAPLGSLQQGYRHLPLHDSQMSQYLFSTLFVRMNVNRTSTPST